MPRSLEFTFKGKTFSREIEKLDRTKLYGSVTVETVTVDGDVCKLSTLANDGRTLIPNGGTAFGYVNPAGEWVDRGDLVPVDMKGKPLVEMKSSFKAPTEIAEEVDIETFLDHSIRLCYRLNGDDPVPKPLMTALEKGKIFRIPFSYRGGIDPDIAFILQGERGSIWMLIGEETGIEFIGLEEAALCGADKAQPDDDEEDDAGDGLDFGML